MHDDTRIELLLRELEIKDLAIMCLLESDAPFKADEMCDHTFIKHGQYFCFRHYGGPGCSPMKLVVHT